MPSERYRVHPLEAYLLGVRELGDRGLVHPAERDEAHRGRVHVHTRDVLRVDPAEVRCDERSEVAALRAVALVPQPAHQLGERPGDPVAVPTRLTGRPGEPEARQRRDNQVKGVCRVAPVRLRVAKRPDHVEELDHRAGPAVAEDQREGVRLGRADVQEVDVLAVDLGGELRVLV